MEKPEIARRAQTALPSKSQERLRLLQKGRRRRLISNPRRPRERRMLDRPYMCGGATRTADATCTADTARARSKTRTASIARATNSTRRAQKNALLGRFSKFGTPSLRPSLANTRLSSRNQSALPLQHSENRRDRIETLDAGKLLRAPGHSARSSRPPQRTKL